MRACWEIPVRSGSRAGISPPALSAHHPGVALAALAAVVATVSGCGTATQPDKAQGPQAPQVSAVDINAAPRDRLKQGGAARWAVEQFSAQWNYNHVDGPAESTSTVMGALMPSAFRTDARGLPAANPDYVLSAEVTARVPRQVVTLRLNDKARWSDGTPITWKDYAAQAAALSGREAGYKVANSTGYDQVERVDRGATDYETLVTFSKPYSEWQSLFSLLYPAATNTSPTVFNSGWLNRVPVTAGPFKLDRIDKTTKSVILVRDEKWWGEPAKLDKLIFRAMDSEAGVNAFANTEVDVVDVGPNAQSFAKANATPGGEVRTAAGADYRHFTLNGTSPVLSDLRVRQAVALAIDRQAIARSDLQDLDWPAVTMDNHVFVNTQEGYQDNTGGLGRPDPLRAGQLLDDAGWKRDGGPGTFRHKDGKELTLRFVVPAEVPIGKREGDLAQTMLAEVGIRVQVQPVPPDDYFDKYVAVGHYEITPFSWLGSSFPLSTARPIYANPTKDAAGELQIQENFARIGSEKIDALLDRASVALEPGVARELLNQADALIWAEAHSLPLFQRPQFIATRTELANVGAFGFQSKAYQDIGFLG